jgi:hypothetical protein
MTAEKKTTGDARDHKRSERVGRALDRLKYRSYYVDKVDEKHKKIGRQRTAVATYVDGLAIDSDEIIVSGVVYDGPTGEIAAPYRLVLDLDDARKLQAQLGLWIAALEGNRS